MMDKEEKAEKRAVSKCCNCESDQQKDDGIVGNTDHYRVEEHINEFYINYLRQFLLKEDEVTESSRIDKSNPFTTSSFLHGPDGGLGQINSGNLSALFFSSFDEEPPISARAGGFLARFFYEKKQLQINIGVISVQKQLLKAVSVFQMIQSQKKSRSLVFSQSDIQKLGQKRLIKQPIKQVPQASFSPIGPQG